MNLLRERYRIASCTDKGRVKDVNQDSFSVQKTLIHGKEVLLAVVCDGMGGLEKGEVASVKVSTRFEKWFAEELPEIMESADFSRHILNSWDHMLQEENQALVYYGREQGFDLGTTVTAMLFIEQQYFIAHVGDSRAYEISKRLRQLTEDQTLVASEVAKGTLTVEQARKDSRKNILLQCVGVTPSLHPVYIRGKIQKKAVYLLCSDGFRHKLSEDEIHAAFYPRRVKRQKALEKRCQEMVALNMERGERDNITVVAVFSG